MGYLMNRARRNNQATVYLLRIESPKNSCFKIGYTTDLDRRIALVPSYIHTELLDTVTGSRAELYAFEQWLHKAKDRKRHYWKGEKRWAGYTELYKERLDLDAQLERFRASSHYHTIFGTKTDTKRQQDLYV